MAENSGMNANEVVPKLVAANEQEPTGLNVMIGEVEKISELQIHDHRKTKEWAIRLAAESAITILKIDQIIIAKPAGGPKMNQKNQGYDEDWSCSLYNVFLNLLNFIKISIEINFVMNLNKSFWKVFTED